jgi:uncharacterized protein
VSERDGYAHGVPCWVDVFRPEPEAAVRFYADLFGWEVENRTPSDSRQYLVCTLRGRDVAAIGSPPSADAGADWHTYVWVDSVGDAVAKALAAGGSIGLDPFASFDGGRMAVLADPAGGIFGVWQPRAHRGAQLVNEPGAWAMSILNTSDVEGATRFYGAVFGWRAEAFDAGGSELTMWRLPGYVGGEPEQPVPRDVVAVGTPAPDESTAGTGAYWRVNFWVDDADGVATKTARLGGTVLEPPVDGAGFREAVIADPHGAAVAVSQLTAAA